MKTTINNAASGIIVYNLVDAIQKNKDYLSEIDGLIGDGDHGVNMNKGFTLFNEKLEKKELSLSQALAILSETLMDDIGGSMGPLYGVFFGDMSAAINDTSVIDKITFKDMLHDALAAVEEIGGAKRGDKTLLDTIYPAYEAYCSALESNSDFYNALEALKSGATAGWKSTEEMIAKIGRASRLGERSRGVLDAGATSCHIILSSMADSIQDILKA